MAKKPNWAKGEFIPKNPEKYIGAGKIIYRRKRRNPVIEKKNYMKCQEVNN